MERVNEPQIHTYSGTYDRGKERFQETVKMYKNY